MSEREVIKVVFNLIIKDNNYFLMSEKQFPDLSSCLEVFKNKLSTHIQNRILIEKQSFYSEYPSNNFSSEPILSYRHPNSVCKSDKYNALQRFSEQDVEKFNHPKLVGNATNYKNAKRKKLIYAIAYYYSLGFDDSTVCSNVKITLYYLRNLVKEYNITETTFKECTQ